METHGVAARLRFWPFRGGWVSGLKGMHDDVLALSTAFGIGSPPARVKYFAERLLAALVLCRSLMERLYAKVNFSRGRKGIGG